MKELKLKTGLRISMSTLRKYLKEELGLTYKVIKPITFNHNKHINKMKRQFAAAKYIEFLE